MKLLLSGIAMVLLAIWGDGSAATNTGYGSAAIVEGKQSVACGLGVVNKAKGKRTCWLVLAEWIKSEDEWVIKTVNSVKVDGKKIKEDVFYTLKEGIFVEVEE